MKTYFTSDWHIADGRILTHLDENGKQLRPFKSLTEMENTLINNYNSTVEDQDTCYFLGDMILEREGLELINELNGKKILVLGNWDQFSAKTYLKYFQDVRGAVVLPQYRIIATHYPTHVDCLTRLVSVHGHCVDSETEILTTQGFKKYNEILEGDSIYSMNHLSKKLEMDSISKIILNSDYDGPLYHVKSKGLDMVVTDEHRVAFEDAKGNYKVEIASKAFARCKVTLFKSFDSQLGTGLDLSDNMLALYIALAADGNITSYDLCRFSLLKPRKILFIKNLLNCMSITFTENIGKKFTYLNFRLPDELKTWKVKGLDSKLLNASRHQVSIIKNTYSQTDGNRDLIFSSKLEEVNLLQHLFVINGYMCKVHSRKGHGFSTNWSYQLSVSDNTTQQLTQLKNKVSTTQGDRTLVWCISTASKNENFIARRKGSVFLTGNCHTYTIQDPRYYSVCPEVNNYHPVDLEDIIKTFKNNVSSYI